MIGSPAAVRPMPSFTVDIDRPSFPGIGGARTGWRPPGDPGAGGQAAGAAAS